MTDEAVSTFANDLAAAVREAVKSEGGGFYEEVEFTRIILDQLCEGGIVDNAFLLWQEGTFGRLKYKISGYAFSDDDERLLLVNTVYTGDLPPRQLSTDEIFSACKCALKFYESSCKGLHTKIDPSNSDTSDIARRIYEVRDRIAVVRILLLSDGYMGLKSVDLRQSADGTRVLVDLYGIERLHRALGKGQTRDDIVLDFRGKDRKGLTCLRISESGADYEAFLTAVPGRLLADIYEKYGTRLLELNVRAFLGIRGRKSINAGLRTTILQEPHRFFAYNNGIVATVDSVELTELGEGLSSLDSLRGLQIVNGGQTTASLHRSWRNDRADLRNVLVSMKIIVVGGADLDRMVGAISRSANSQNTVQPADFSANNSFHVGVEELANNTWLPDSKSRWFYERARGSYSATEAKLSHSVVQKRRFHQETPKSRRFSKTDLAKYLNAWHGFPHLVSFGNQKNFQHFMQNMKERYPDGWLPDADWYKRFIATAIVFRTVQLIVKAAKFPAYQANITAYTVAALSFTYGERVNL